MLTVIIGGSGSGKSAYAENLLCEQAKDAPRYYVATMQVYGAEGEKRVKRHRLLRQGKGFHTIEAPKDISKAIAQIEAPQLSGEKFEAGVLLECLSNLVANEMFLETGVLEEQKVCDKVFADLMELYRHVKNLVIVTNNVFEDGIVYEEDTMAYIRALGMLNQRLTKEADEVTEIVYTIPVQIKGKTKERKDKLCL